jgi:hypothetical protein
MPTLRRNCRHDRVADRLDDGAGSRADDLVQDFEVLTNHEVGVHVAHTVVERRRFLQIGEQVGDVGNGQAFAFVDELGLVEFAEARRQQQPLAGQEGFVLRQMGPDVRATYDSERPVASRLRSYRLVSGNGGNQDSRRTVQSS